MRISKFSEIFFFREDVPHFISIYPYQLECEPQRIIYFQRGTSVERSIHDAATEKRSTRLLRAHQGQFAYLKLTYQLLQLHD